MIKYFDYFFKLSIIAICIVFLVLFYNFTKSKYIKVMLIPDKGNNFEISVDNLKQDEEYKQKYK
jgi:hypothetical protein